MVLSTVIEAADRDYQLYVLSDGTEDPDEQTRDVLLGKVFPRRAQVIDTATLRTLLGNLKGQRQGDRCSTGRILTAVDSRP